MNNKQGIRGGVCERLCIALSLFFRKIFRFESPFDLLDLQKQESLLEDNINRGDIFIHRFAQSLDVEGKIVLELGCSYGGLQAALLHEGAARTIGLDLDYHALSFGRKKLDQKQDIMLLAADAHYIPFPPSSVDVVVSDSVFEHLQDIEQTLREIAHVLCPKGRLYAYFGPTWFTYNGPHLIKCISIPWVHLFFSRKTIVNVLTYYKKKATFPPSYLEAKIADFQRMGRLSLRKFHRAVKASGLDVIQETNASPNLLKRNLARLPVFKELLAGEIHVILEKPDR
ncbi:MAG: class I SAM-dependent methyltransferase [Candidatus Aminicenantaceae bacterium]